MKRTTFFGGLQMKKAFTRFVLHWLRFDLMVARSTERNPDNVAAIEKLIQEWELVLFHQEQDLFAGLCRPAVGSLQCLLDGFRRTWLGGTIFFNRRVTK